jgi:hypothetical protein
MKAQEIKKGDLIRFTAKGWYSHGRVIRMPESRNDYLIVKVRTGIAYVSNVDSITLIDKDSCPYEDL